MCTLIRLPMDPLLVCLSGFIHGPTVSLTMYSFPGSKSQHHYSGSAGYENQQLSHPPPHITGPPHFHHLPHYQPDSGHAYPHHPSDSAININSPPLPPSQDSSESRIPLPTMLTRPPPPDHSAAVDGYRNITAALSAALSNQQLIFGRIRSQTAEENANLSASSPEFPGNVSDESTGNVSSGPRLPPFTVGVRQEGPVVVAKGNKFQNIFERGESVSAGGSSISRIADRTNPEVTFEFGSFVPLDVTPGSTSEPAGELGQVAPTELDSLKSDTGDEWQVRDFGYGFGHMSGKGNAAAVVREEINAREQRRVRERREREEQERRQKEEQEREKAEVPQERPRRGSVNEGYERGTYPSRRGRGSSGGNGRGYGHSFSRGGYSQYPRHKYQYSPTPPAQLSQLPHVAHGYSPDQSVYFLPPPLPPPSFGPYHPGGYEVYQYPSFPPPPALHPPVPHPISQLPYQLDPARYYLLGQLEYYLSPQNMAQDFYLRQQASVAE